MAVADFLGATFLCCCCCEDDLDFLDEDFFLGDASESDAVEALLLLALLFLAPDPFLLPILFFSGPDDADEARLDLPEALDLVLRPDFLDPCDKEELESPSEEEEEEEELFSSLSSESSSLDEEEDDEPEDELDDPEDPDEDDPDPADDDADVEARFGGIAGQAALKLTKVRMGPANPTQARPVDRTPRQNTTFLLHYPFPVRCRLAATLL